MLLKDCCEIYYSLPVKNNNAVQNCLLSPADFKENNQIIIKEAFNFININSCIQPQKGDILIKRINPNFVNVYNSTKTSYLGNNIILLRTNQSNCCFIAYILEQNLAKLKDLANNSNRLNAINRGQLEALEIPDILINQQEMIGDLWKLQKLKISLLEKLSEKEKQKQRLINKKIIKNIGENKNGRI